MGAVFIRSISTSPTCKPNPVQRDAAAPPLVARFQYMPPMRTKKYDALAMKVAMWMLLIKNDLYHMDDCVSIRHL